MEVLCERCEANPAVHFYRDYRGPHAYCGPCYCLFANTRSDEIRPSDKEEYIEEVIIDQLMTQ